MDALNFSHKKALLCTLNKRCGDSLKHLSIVEIANILYNYNVYLYIGKYVLLINYWIG